MRLDCETTRTVVGGLCAFVLVAFPVGAAAEPLSEHEAPHSPTLLQTSEPRSLTAEPPIVGRALLARFTDYALVVGGSAGLQFLTSQTVGVPSPQWFETRTWRLSAWTMATVSVPLWTYFTLLDAGPSSATLGKRLFGLRVENDDGTELSLSKSLLRTAVTFAGWELAHVAMFVPRNFVTDTPATWQYVGMSIATAWLVADLVVTVATGGHKGIADLLLGTRSVRRVDVDRRVDGHAMGAHRLR